MFAYEALMQTFAHVNILLLLAQNVRRRPVTWLASAAPRIGLVHPGIYSLSQNPVLCVSFLAPVTIDICAILICDMPLLPESKPQEGLGLLNIASIPGPSPGSGVWRGERVS